MRPPLPASTYRDDAYAPLHEAGCAINTRILKKRKKNIFAGRPDTKIVIEGARKFCVSARGFAEAFQASRVGTDATSGQTLPDGQIAYRDIGTAKRPRLTRCQRSISASPLISELCVAQIIADVPTTDRLTLCVPTQNTGDVLVFPILPTVGSHPSPPKLCLRTRLDCSASASFSEIH